MNMRALANHFKVVHAENARLSVQVTRLTTENGELSTDNTRLSVELSLKERELVC